MTHRLNPSPLNPHLDELLKKANEAFDRLTPEAKRAHREAQRKSWCIGETMLEYPEMTREEAEKLYDEAVSRSW